MVRDVPGKEAHLRRVRSLENQIDDVRREAEERLALAIEMRRQRDVFKEALEHARGELERTSAWGHKTTAELHARVAELEQRPAVLAPRYSRSLKAKVGRAVRGQVHSFATWLLEFGYSDTTKIDPSSAVLDESTSAEVT